MNSLLKILVAFSFVLTIFSSVFVLNIPKSSELIFYAKNKYDIEDYYCHVANVYNEARDQSVQAMIDIIYVVRNRLKYERYNPTGYSSDCMIIYQPNQFSWTKDADRDRCVWYKIDSFAQKAVEDSSIKPVCDNQLQILHELYPHIYCLDGWEKSKKAVKQVLDYGANPSFPEATHYYTVNKNNPNWRPNWDFSKMKYLGQSGDQRFYIELHLT